MNSQEWLSLWYLRLNGYFTMPTFVAHGKQGPLTDVDVLGVRFPNSEESDFKDDDALCIPPNVIDIVFTEAKAGLISELNGPWSCPEKGALDYVLGRVGVVPKDQVSELTAELYRSRKLEFNGIDIRIVCMGREINPELQEQGVTFVSWSQVLQFIHWRFSANQRLKADHGAWDKFGKYLWNKLEPNVPDAESFFAGWEKGS